MKERDYQLKLVRMEHMVDVRHPETLLTLTQLDERIKKSIQALSDNVSPDVLNQLKDSYKQHLQNIEHELAKNVQAECQKHWIHALK
jgi:hypothetical protein